MPFKKQKQNLFLLKHARGCCRGYWRHQAAMALILHLRIEVRTVETWWMGPDHNCLLTSLGQVSLTHQLQLVRCLAKLSIGCRQGGVGGGAKDGWMDVHTRQNSNT